MMNRPSQKITIRHCALVIATCVFWLASALAAGLSPNETIEEAVALLSEQMDGRKEELSADKDALYAMINGILLPRFDKKYAARLVLGKHSRKASDEQRHRFTEAFYHTLLQRYSDGLLEFSADRIAVLPYRDDASKKTTTVKTIVRLEDDTKVPVNYVLRKKDVGWQMIDVTVEGISYVRNFRAEIDSETRSAGLSKVIERLETEAGM